MSQTKQIERIIRILQRLSLGGEVTVNKLYDYFEHKVPKRTLQRDLVELSSANVPLVTKKGHGKELIWYLDSNYLKFIPSTLGSQELLASYFLEKLGAVAKGTPLEKDILSLLDKSRQLISPELFEVMDDQKFGESLFAATYIGYVDYSSHSQTIERAITAIKDCRVCSFNYKPTWKERGSKFDGNPYMILYHKGALYLVAHLPHYNNYVFLPIQRIVCIELTDEKFTRDPDFSLDKLREGRFGIFGHESIKPEQVVLKFNKEIAEIVAEKIWHATQKLTKNKDGSLTMEMKVVISDELRSWIGGWLDYVKVIKPKKLKKF